MTFQETDQSVEDFRETKGKFRENFFFHINPRSQGRNTGTTVNEKRNRLP